MTNFFSTRQDTKRAAPLRRCVLLAIGIGLLVTACGSDDGEGGDTSADEQSSADAPDSEPTDESTEAEDEATGEVEEVTILMSTGSGSASYFNYYIADALGFFEEEGLSVSFQYGPGSSSAVQQLIAGNADFSVVTPASVVGSLLEEFDLRFVEQHFYANRFNVVVPEDSSIESMDDLRGENIGISEAAGGEVPTVRASIAISGLVEGEDVNIVQVGEGASALQALENGQVAALGASKPDMIALSNAGLAVRPITPEEIGRFPGDGLAVRPETVQDERLVRLLRGSIKGWMWAQANPDAAYEILKAEYAREQLSDDEFGRAFFEENLGDTTPPEGIDKGVVPTEDMDQLIQFFADLGIMDGVVDIDAMVDNSAIEAAWSQGIDRAAVEAATAPG